LLVSTVEAAPPRDLVGGGAHDGAITMTTKTVTTKTVTTWTTTRRARKLPGWTLLAGLLLGAAAGPAQARCYTPTEQTVGWKRAPIPDAAPGLVVADTGATSPRDPIGQFRADEQAVVWLGSEHASLSAATPHPGRIEYMFRVDGGQWQLLHLQLARGLAGEKVDAIAYTPGGPVPLWLERRVSGAEVAVEWSLPGVYAIAVSFHHHLRERPVVTSWQAGLRTTVSAAAWAPPGFRQPRSLYYYHPGGRTLILCDEPGRELGVRRDALSGADPTTVRLLPR
jgi:hypothetical protein